MERLLAGGWGHWQICSDGALDGCAADVLESALGYAALVLSAISRCAFTPPTVHLHTKRLQLPARHSCAVTRLGELALA